MPNSLRKINIVKNRRRRSVKVQLLIIRSLSSCCTQTRTHRTCSSTGSSSRTCPTCALSSTRTIPSSLPGQFQQKIIAVYSFFPSFILPFSLFISFMLLYSHFKLFSQYGTYVGSRYFLVFHGTIEAQFMVVCFRHADQRLIWLNSPSMHGFINAKKRTNIAGQVAGQLSFLSISYFYIIFCFVHSRYLPVSILNSHCKRIL